MLFAAAVEREERAAMVRTAVAVRAAHADSRAWRDWLRDLER